MQKDNQSRSQDTLQTNQIALSTSHTRMPKFHPRHRNFREEGPLNLESVSRRLYVPQDGHPSKICTIATARSQPYMISRRDPKSPIRGPQCSLKNVWGRTCPPSRIKSVESDLWSRESISQSRQSSRLAVFVIDISPRLTHIAITTYRNKKQERLMGRRANERGPWRRVRSSALTSSVVEVEALWLKRASTSVSAAIYSRRRDQRLRKIKAWPPESSCGAADGAAMQIEV